MGRRSGTRRSDAGQQPAGRVPWQNLMLDGYAGTAPVGAFSPNGYGLYDMTGNVWGWTRDSFTPSHSQKPCCAPPFDERIPCRMIKGGSRLCAPTYLRFRPAARQGEAVDTSTSHIDFRCILRST